LGDQAAALFLFRDSNPLNQILTIIKRYNGLVAAPFNASFPPFFYST